MEDNNEEQPQYIDATEMIRSMFGAGRTPSVEDIALQQTRVEESMRWHCLLIVLQSIGVYHPTQPSDAMLDVQPMDPNIFVMSEQIHKYITTGVAQ